MIYYLFFGCWIWILPFFLLFLHVLNFSEIFRTLPGRIPTFFRKIPKKYRHFLQKVRKFPEKIVKFSRKISEKIQNALKNYRKLPKKFQKNSQKNYDIFQKSSEIVQGIFSILSVIRPTVHIGEFCLYFIVSFENGKSKMKNEFKVETLCFVMYIFVNEIFVSQ